MSDVVMRQNDRLPYLTATLKDLNGAVDLTGETVRFVARSSDNTIKIDQTSTSTSVLIVQGAAGTSGVIQYRWQEGDTDTPGVLLGEIETTNLSSERATYPNQGSITININPERAT